MAQRPHVSRLTCMEHERTAQGQPTPRIAPRIQSTREQPRYWASAVHRDDARASPHSTERTGVCCDSACWRARLQCCARAANAPALVVHSP
eukprot:1576317-Prymnesium_polylepis.1